MLIAGAKGVVKSGVALEARYHGGRLRIEPRQRRAEDGLGEIVCPRVERLDLGLADAERREQAPRKARQPFLGDDDPHAGERVPDRLARRDTREAVQRDGGLPAPGTAEDEERLFGRRADGRELLGVEQCRHVGGSLACARADAEASRSCRGAGPAGHEGERAAIGACPSALAGARQGELVADDAGQHAVDDDDDAPRFDHALRHPARERFLVRVPLAMAVEDLGHGGHAPIDDAHAPRRIQKARPSEQVVFDIVRFANAKVGEVRRGGIGEHLFAAALEQALSNAHFEQERRQIVRAGGRGLVAERAQRVDRSELAHPRACRLDALRVERRPSLRQERFFVVDDSLLLGRQIARFGAHWK